MKTGPYVLGVLIPLGCACINIPFFPAPGNIASFVFCGGIALFWGVKLINDD